MQLHDVLSRVVEPTTKGWPSSIPGLRLEEIGKQGWSLRNQDLTLPAMVLKDSAIRHNSRWMQAFLRRHDVALCPHGKTTMAPQLFARQLADGASGITVATVQQMRLCHRFGVKRVLMANQLIGRQAIHEVLSTLDSDPEFDFYCLVDSIEGVAKLDCECRTIGCEKAAASAP